jgi:general secretion pathway protein M
MEQLKQLVADAQAAFQRLTTRERNLVMLAGGAICAFILFLIILSFSSSATGYRRRTEDKLRKLADVQTLATSFRDAESQRQAVEQQLTSSNVQLGSYLEEKSKAAGLEIPAMSNRGPTPIGDGKIFETTVEFTLNDISLKKLNDFLSLVESGPGVVKVKYVRLEPKVASETLNAFVNIATYQMKP